MRRFTANGDSICSIHRIHSSALYRKMSEIEKEKKKSWTEVLPFLFSLLVENADAIIDDTSFPACPIDEIR